MTKYFQKVAQSNSFIIFKQLKFLFKISFLNNGSWKKVIDFTKIKKGGVKIDKILYRL